MFYNEKSHFEQMPIDVLIHIFSWLDPESLTKVKAVNKNLKKIGERQEANKLWERKFSKHFPHLMVKVQSAEGKNINWYEEFCKAYKDEYKSKNDAKIFSLIKEGDIEGLKALKPNLTHYLDLQDANGKTILDWACISLHQDVACMSLHQDVLDLIYQEIRSNRYSPNNTELDVQKTDEDGNTILHWAIICNQPIETIDSLLQAGAVIDAISPMGHLTFYNSIIKSVSLTLNTANAPSEINGFTPLHFAAYYHHSNLFNALIERGADINAMASSRISLLHTAVDENNLAATDILIKKGLYVDSHTALEGFTPLHIAAYSGKPKVVDSLLEGRANVNQATMSLGITPLMLAIYARNIEVIEMLLRNNANINAVFYYNVTALHQAAWLGADKIVRLLLSYGANINAKDAKGMTPMDMAVNYDHKPVIKLLCESQLIDYIKKLKDESTPEFEKFKVFGVDIWNEAFTKQQRLNAAYALLEFIKGNKEMKDLEPHKGPLNSGELKNIYKNLKLTIIGERIIDEKISIEKIEKGMR